MKNWLKYLIGVALGIVAAIVIPFESAQAQSVLDFIVDFVIRFGRYTLLPLLFFSIATAFFKLRDEKIMVRTALWTAGVIIASSLMLVILGLLSSIIIKLPRIPITVEKVSDIPSIDIKDLVLRLFPYSGFSALVDRKSVCRERV